MKIKYLLYSLLAPFVTILLLVFSCTPKNKNVKATAFQEVKVSKNGHYFQAANGSPFFWLADTGWLAFKKLDREALNTYFEDRKNKGFNVIQIMTMHSEEMVNIYGDSALVNNDVSKPLVPERSR